MSGRCGGWLFAQCASYPVLDGHDHLAACRTGGEGFETLGGVLEGEDLFDVDPQRPGSDLLAKLFEHVSDRRGHDVGRGDVTGAGRRVGVGGARAARPGRMWPPPQTGASSTPIADQAFANVESASGITGSTGGSQVQRHGGDQGGSSRPTIL
jgi:hypothetical protein